MRALLMGPAVHPFRAGLEKMVTTHWDFVEVGFAMDDADVVRGLADADAAIGISFTKAAPPAPRLPPRRSPPQTGVRSDAGGD